MKTHLSGPFIRLATAAPVIGKSAVLLAAHMFPHRERHWALRYLASELDCRVPVDTVLGNGMKIRVVWADSVGTEICTRGYYELSTVRLIERSLKPGMVFIDAGAHVGQYTLLAAGFGADVHSFEPEPQTFELLRHNVQANRLKNVRLNRCALAEAWRSTTLQTGPAENVGSASLSSTPRSRASFPVQCRSLSSYTADLGIAEVHWMKIDVEGAELHVLRGAQAILTGASKPQIIIEFAEENLVRFGSSCSQLAEFLTELGYKLFRITDSGLIAYVPRQPEDRFFNVLASSSNSVRFEG